jgi:hypothetical protein
MYFLEHQFALVAFLKLLFLNCFMYLPHTIIFIILLQQKMMSGERSVTISLQEESMEYLSQHVIDGRNLFPATGYLVSCTTLFC